MIWSYKTRIVIFSRRSLYVHFTLVLQRTLLCDYFIRLTSFSCWPLAKEGILPGYTLVIQKKIAMFRHLIQCSGFADACGCPDATDKITF